MDPQSLEWEALCAIGWQLGERGEYRDPDGANRLPLDMSKAHVLDNLWWDHLQEWCIRPDPALGWVAFHAGGSWSVDGATLTEVICKTLIEASAANNQQTD